MHKPTGSRVSLSRPWRQIGVGLVVLGVHGLSLLAWVTHGRDTVAASKSTVVSITVSLPGLPETPVPLTQRETRPRVSPVQPPLNHADTARRAYSGAPVASPAVGAVPDVPGGQPLSAHAQSPPTSTLQLDLSRKALSALAAPGFATQTPFQVRLPATVERQVAQAFAESGPWTEERVDNDHVRLRRGNTCVMMERPQAAILDPFSEAAQRLPWRVSTYRCQ